MKDTMQWDDIRFFIALAREGSLSATARKLHVEHSTVARRVGNLEQTLQLKLFNRLARGWVLTAEGLQLFEKASLLEMNMYALQRVALKSEVLTGKVQLSAPPLLINYFLLPHLAAFKEQYPDITLELVGERRKVDMMRGEADLALRMTEPDEPELIARPLATIHYALYSTDFYLQLPESEYVFIGFDNSNPQLSQKIWLDSYVGSRDYCLLTNDIMTMYQAALHHLGIAFLPQFLADKDDKLSKVTSPPFPTAPLYLVMHPDIRLAPRVRAVADFIIAITKQHQHVL